MFPKNSAFYDDREKSINRVGDFLKAMQPKVSDTLTTEVKTDELEEWYDRLMHLSIRAEDHGLDELGDDLLDLRDAIYRYLR